MKSPNGPLRIGIGGPVGSGKTTLCEMLLKAMRDRFFNDTDEPCSFFVTIISMIQCGWELEA